MKRSFLQRLLTTFSAACIVMTVPNVLGNGRAGGVYEITSDTLDAGGGSAAGGSFTMSGSADEWGGTSANDGTNAMHGFAGQLFSVTAVSLFADQNARELAAAGRLFGSYLADDGTTGWLDGADVGWSVLSGPLSSISQDGVMTGGVVGQDTAATVRGSYAGLSADVSLSVLDTLVDNFGTYGGDGIPDIWQIDHFGENNPLAAPLIDADHDGQDNLFEFTAGLTPLDAASRFVLEIEPDPAQAGQMRLVFSPRLTGRSYTVKSAASLASAVWEPLVDSTASDAGSVRTVTDRAADGAVKFYQVEITKP